MADIVYSLTANRIIESAFFLRRKFNSTRTSILHALLAAILIEEDPFEVADHEEIKAAVEKMGIESEKVFIFRDILSKYFRENTEIPKEQFSYFDIAQGACLEYAKTRNGHIVYAPTLIGKIMEVAAEVIAPLKDKIDEEYEKFKLAEAETETSAKTEEETSAKTEEETSTKTEEETSTKTGGGTPFEAEYGFDIDEIYEDDEGQVFDLVSSVKDLQSDLLKEIYGQDEAVSALVSGYFNALANGRKDSKPLATFLFAGAPGVGKTFLAETAAGILMKPFKRFDMSSFSDKEAAFSFAGSNKVYRNGHAGLVTDFVRKNPDCVILFDEIEKAHINVIHLFLQILDAGHLKDIYTEKDVSFKDAIIIMTTNVGRSLYENNDDALSKAAVSRKVIINALSNEKNPATDEPFFPAAICSRFASGNILLFNPLGALDLIHISESRIKEYCDRFSAKQGIEVEFDKHVAPALLFSEGGKVDARSLKGRSENFISSEIYNWLKFAFERDLDSVSDLKRLKIRVDVDGGGEATWLFKDDETPNVLLFSERKVYYRVLSCTGFNFFTASTAGEAKDIISKQDIDFAICDILRDRSEKTLNIEDTASAGRQLFDTFVREDIPFYVFCNRIHQINKEEQQALMEQKAHGLFKCYKLSDPQKLLEKVQYEISCERKLTRLARANKVLTFDCSYESEDAETGVILINDLRVSPAIDAEDKKTIAPLDVSNVTFDQIIGAEDAKEELKSFISFLKNPKEYAHFGIPAPKGLILYGPPGTGKTMLAKALARESGATFIATEGNMFLKSAVGKGGESIHEVFSKARKYAPCILFIDEIDVIALNRMNGGSSSTANDALNALLNEMDGFSTNPTKPVFVLAATNFDVTFGAKSALDPAVLRRFDRRIYVDLPDKEERKKFMLLRLAKSRQKLSDEIIDNIAMRSIGMSLAELGLVVDFALRNMLRENSKTLSDELFLESFETFCYGEKHVWNEETIKRVAIHESGHAYISWESGNKPNYITVSSRNKFGGYMQHEGKDSPILTIKDLKNLIRSALAGRAAEIVFFGDNDGLSTGAAGDLQTATKIAMNMITQFGMSSEHGLAVEGSPSNKAVELCNEILNEQFEYAVKLITENKERVLKLADMLIVKNHLIGNNIDEIFRQR